MLDFLHLYNSVLISVEQ